MEGPVVQSKKDSESEATVTKALRAAALSIGESTLIPIDPNIGSPQTSGFGFQKRIQRLRAVRENDPEVNRIVALLLTKLEAGPATASPGLAAELRVPGSTSREVLGAYLEWVGHRGAKPPAASAEEQNSRKALDPALLCVRVGAIIDLIVERIVKLDLPVPDEAAPCFLALFHGGADRIQVRANRWMLNGDIEAIFNAEQTLLDDKWLSEASLFEAIKLLADLDGGSPSGFQRPLAPGEDRRVRGGRAKYGELSPAVASTALLRVDDSPVALLRRDSVINVLQQSPAAQSAVTKIEQYLSEMTVGSPEYAECVDTFRAYSDAMLYDSHKLWAANGVLDTLIEVSITLGNQVHREAVLEFLYEGSNHVQAIISKDFSRGDITYRHIDIGVKNLVQSRQSWDVETLDFVCKKLDWLQSIKSAKELDAATISKVYQEVVEMRRKEYPNATQLMQALGGNGSDLQRIEYGPYRIELAVRMQTADGTPGKVLEIRNLSTDLPDDSEPYETLRRIEQLAVKEGFTAIQLAEWSRIHQARVFEASGEYSVVMTTVPVGQHGATSLEPTFFKALKREVKTLQLPIRSTYTEYLQAQFAASHSLDLSGESSILGEEAHRYKQRHGGKCMGQVLVDKLIHEFGDARLKTLPFLNLSAAQIAGGVVLPQSILQNGVGATELIARSNAAFEYGSPPGILASVAGIQMPHDGSLKLDCQGMQSAFDRIVQDNALDDRSSFQVLVQPLLNPRASGIVYSSFSTRADEPAVIQASIGPCVSATVGLGNLIHYRVRGSEVETHRNFSGDTPGVVFHRKTCYIDPVECDPSRRELDLYRSVTPDLQALQGEALDSIWQENTFKIDSEPFSPLKQEELEVLSQFAKFAEGRLNKPLKLEFGISEDGGIYILQLDPAMLEVSDTSFSLSRGSGDLVLETPFVNMPFNVDGLHVVLEAVAGFGYKAPDKPFIFVSETVPLNINIQNELVRPYPHVAGILAASGSRMNHCYSEARTFIPFVGCVGLREKLRKAFPDVCWGHNPDLRVDVRSDGRKATVRFYRNL